MDSGQQSLPRTLFDTQVSTAVPTLVVPRVAHRLRATIPPDTLAAVHADQPPVGRGESLAVLGDIERVGPAGEHLTVARFVIAPVLSGVDEFMPHCLAELRPAEFLVGIPGKPARDRFGVWIVFGDASLSLGPLGNLLVDRFNRELREVFYIDVGRMRLRLVKQSRSYLRRRN